MKNFHCQCGQRVFYDNTSCMNCGRALGFDPDTQDVVSLDSADGRLTDVHGTSYRSCRNGLEHRACNWLVADDSDAEYCPGCQLNGTIPDLSSGNNLQLWMRIEKAKRRMLYGLMSLNLPVFSGDLKFHFLEDQRTNPWVAEPHVVTGHNAGNITLNIAEADDVAREAIRVEFHEPHRTLLGHFRHEVGHYFWPRMVHTPAALKEFRTLFGDERIDYAGALSRHHAVGPPTDWWRSFVSAYASAHPHEDWAESWAHYLLISDALESATENSLTPWREGDDWIGQWMELSVALNELSRSVGVSDAYPFSITASVRSKLEFIHQRVEALRQTAEV